MYSTHYTVSDNEHVNASAEHENLATALSNWVDNCATIEEASGGRSVLTDITSGEELIWDQQAGSGKASGAVAEQDATGEAGTGETPSQVANQILSSRRCRSNPAC